MLRHMTYISGEIDVAEEFDPLFQDLMVTGCDSERANSPKRSHSQAYLFSGGRPNTAHEEHHDSLVVPMQSGKSCILSQLTSSFVSETKRAGEL